MIRILLEGYSKESMEDAVANAMAKAAAYLTEDKDVNITVKELTVLPGRGYKAVIEVVIIPMKESERFKPAAQDVDLKRHYYREIKKMKKEVADHLKHMISYHFSISLGSYLPDIPDYFLQNINDSNMLNFDIERMFFKASQAPLAKDVPGPDKDTPDIKDVLGRRPEPE